MPRSSLQVGAYFMIGLNVSNIADLFTGILEWEMGLSEESCLFYLFLFGEEEIKLNTIK